MTEPIDKATKDLIKNEAEEYGYDIPSAVQGYVRGATVWAERLKQAEKLIEAYKHLNEMRAKKAGKQVIKNAQNILHTALNEWNSLPH